MRLIFPRTEDGLEYGEYSNSSVGPSGNTCHIFVLVSTKKSTKVFAFFPKFPIPY